MRWYVIKAVSGRENKVRDAILQAVKQKQFEAQVGEMLVPAERITEVKRGKKVSSERKLYPGYIYIQMDPKGSLIETINEIDGVTGFLGSDPRAPDPLSASEAEQIVKIATAKTSDEQRAAIVQVPFNIDDRVKVKEGTFAGMEGIVAEINAQKGELRVLITVFGRQTPVTLEVWQVEAAV
ncbi:MAG TPA: transcription termination/antitermination protein NusG [Planctomycetota bacterium]|nr:transcription termination/antitermination protein NusG [Planctomycetota bacterium]